MKILDLLFPPKCVCCGEIIGYDDGKSPFCPICHSVWQQDKIRCGDENDGVPLTEYNHKYVVMENGGYAAYLVKYFTDERHTPGNRLIYNLKNNGSRRTVDFVAGEFAGLIRESIPSICQGGARHSDGIITFVPRSKKARRREGFDHMERCALALGKLLDLPALSLIVKRPDAQEQKTLSHAERKVNAESSLELAGGVNLTSKIIVLIDDIITTGASVNTAAKLLREGGAEHIVAVTLAATSHNERIIRRVDENFNLF